MIKEIFPKNTNEKIILFSDRDVNKKIINYNELQFHLEDPKDLTLPGQVEDIIHSVERTINFMYDWPLLTKSNCEGFLLCYLDFIPEFHTDAKELKIRAYKLKMNHSLPKN